MRLSPYVGGRQSPVSYNDPLPEQKKWVDEGCFAHPSCLSCPLPRCLMDLPNPPVNKRSLYVYTMTPELRQAYKNGETITSLSKRTGINRWLISSLVAPRL